MGIGDDGAINRNCAWPCRIDSTASIGLIEILSVLACAETKLVECGAMPDLSARRPLKSRSASWAQIASKKLLQLGATPNQVSVASTLCALGVPVFLFGNFVPTWVAWIGALVCIQLRLVCNLMDGMLAVEGGLKTANGDIFNEFPDRLSDAVILVSLGYAGGDAWSQPLGWLAACGALTTACVRMHGASLTGVHDFQGPQAKPHRMALATGACLLMAVLSVVGHPLPVIRWTLGVMVVGIAVTVINRLRTLSARLVERSQRATGTDSD